MDWIYTIISKILLFWHGLWDGILPEREVLGTNWQWILAIVFLVVTVRVVLFPVFVKQIKSQRAMQALSPKMKELQEKHKGDKESMQKELMELYRTEKVNPLMGCLPMFLQIPVFLGLFHVLKRLNPDPDKTNKDIYSWTKEQFDSASAADLFNAPIAAKFSSSAADIADLGANGTAVKIVAAILVITMMVTTYMTSRQMILKTGWNADPQQRMIQKLMLYGIPLSLLVSGWAFPIGVIIYWVINNLISLGQQFWVLHKYPPPANAPGIPGLGGNKNAPSGKAVSGKAVGTKTTGTKTAGGKAVGGKPSTGKTEPAPKSGAAKLFGRFSAKPEAKTNGADPAVSPVAEGKSLAPKPGAKPTNPKKGGPAKRQSG